MHGTEWEVLWLLVGAVVWMVEHPLAVALTVGAAAAAAGFGIWKWRKG